MSAAKRPRTNGNGRSARRPIDKRLISILKAGVGSSQVSTTLYTTTFPGTVTGLRWSLGAVADAGTGVSVAHWAIVVVKDGLSASTMATSDGSTLYEPEQNVLAFGVLTCRDADSVAPTALQNFTGETKTMRKLMGGDKLVFITIGNAASLGSFQGVVQFFCKS